jgi:serine phosphatase RsbU (regulator of sigma subunit)
MICSLSNTLLQATAQKLPQAIESSLGTIGNFLGVDDVFLYLLSNSQDRVEKTFEWNVRGEDFSRKRFSGLGLSPFAFTLGMSREKQPLVLESFDQLPAGAKPEKIIWSYMGTKSFLGHPLHIQERLIGFFGISSRSRSRTWTDDEIRLANLLAGILANTLNRFRSEKHLLEMEQNELAIAADIQRSLLSPAPIPPDFPMHIGLSSQPSLNVDGDFIDLFRNPDGSIDLIMGDSMGKGVPAALLSAAVKIAILRARAESRFGVAGRRDSLGDILRKVQRETGDKLADMSAFVTLALARYHPDQGTLQIINAGHPSILVWRQNEGRVDSFSSLNPPIGLLQQNDIQSKTIRLGSGDIVLMFSDGLVDARNTDGTFFGEQRVVEILQSTHYLPAQDIATRFFRLCLSFLGKNPLHDDFSCLVAAIP